MLHLYMLVCEPVHCLFSGLTSFCLERQHMDYTTPYLEKNALLVRNVKSARTGKTQWAVLLLTNEFL